MFQVKVSEPLESDTGEFGVPDQLDEEEFSDYQVAKEFCLHTAERGLRAVLYDCQRYIGEFE